MTSSFNAYLHRFARILTVADLAVHDQLIFASVAQSQFFRQWLHTNNQHTSTKFPKILSLQNWLQQQYLLQPHTKHKICDHHHQLQIWHHAICQTQDITLQPPVLWQIARQYQIQYRHEASYLLENNCTETCYLQAKKIYLTYLQDNLLIDSTQLARHFPKWHILVGKNRFLWIGFSTCTPVLQSIINHLPTDQIFMLKPVAKTCTAETLIFPNINEQINYLTAHYLTTHKKKNEQPTVALVLPNAQTQPQLIQPLSKMITQRLNLYPDQTSTIKPFSSLIATPLATHQLTHSIFTLLHFFTQRHHVDILSLFINPIWHKAYIPTSSYHYVINHLRTLGLSTWPKTLLWPESAPKYSTEIYIDLYTLLHYSCPEQTTFTKWQTWLHTLLTQMFMHYEARTQIESNIFSQIFQEIIHNSILPSLAKKNLTYPQYLGYLTAKINYTDITKSTQYQPWVIATWTQILEMPFDQIIFLSTHADTWPGHLSTAHTNDDHTVFWQQIHTQLMCTCTQITFLQPTVDLQQQPLLSSPLLKNIPTKIAPAYIPQHRVFHVPRQTVKQVLAFQGPALSSTEQTLSSNALQRVSRCLAQSFFKNRLHIRSDQSNYYGISAIDIGTLTHAALQKCDHIITNQSAQYNDIKTIISQLIAKKNPFSRLCTIQKNSLLIHVTNTVKQWLDHRHIIHKNDNAVSSQHEVSRTQSLFGITIRMRFDRIDYFSDGRCRIIDYKTGLTNRADWLSKRPQYTQMILYAVSQPNTISLAYACLHPDQFGYSGYSALDNDLKGIKPVHSISLSPPNHTKKIMHSWPKQMSLWQLQLRNLIRDYQSGYYFLNPNAGSTTCQLCQLQPVCRYYEYPPNTCISAKPTEQIA